MNGLLIGRWQTLHKGHDWLVDQVRDRGLRPVLAVRATAKDENNPLSVGERIANIHHRYGDTVDTIVIPDIAAVFYGRDVGYEVVELEPPRHVAEISGTKIRNGNMANG